MRWLLSIVLLSGCVSSEPTPEPQEPEEPAALAPAEVVEAARGAVEQYRQAYEVRSLDALEPLYVRGEELVLINKGERYRGWEAVRIYLEELLEGASEVRMKVTGIEVVALGERSALATVELQREISDGVATVAENGILTLVFQLREGLQGAERWRIIGEHYSKSRR